MQAFTIFSLIYEDKIDFGIIYLREMYESIFCEFTNGKGRYLRAIQSEVETVISTFHDDLHVDECNYFIQIRKIHGENPKPNYHITRIPSYPLPLP